MSALLFIAAALYSHQAVSAAPITTTALESRIFRANNNITILKDEIAPAWSTTTNIRSTASLLWTCVLTLFICVYSVIHTNLPAPGEGQWGNFWRKLKWTLFAILAPELTLAMAVHQWRTARTLRNGLNVLYKKHKEDKVEVQNAAPSLTHFSMYYCFYVEMGGFVVNVADISDKHSYMTLSSEGVLYLAKHGHFLSISEDTIRDKSKADLVTKSLACLQVIWMVAECIGRKASGYPISLLEINVLVHVACALSMYAFWFQKPFDVQEPTIVDSTQFLDHIALFSIRHTLSVQHRRALKLYKPQCRETDASIVPQIANMESQRLTNTNESNIDEIRHERRFIIHSGEQQDTAMKVKDHKKDVILTLLPGQSLPCGFGLKLTGSLGNGPPAYAGIKCNEKRIRGFVRATRAMRKEESYTPAASLSTIVMDNKFIKARSKNLQDSFELAGDRTLKSDFLDDHVFAGLMIILPIFYGTIHVAAWNSDFPSYAEKIIFKVACMLVASGAVVFLVFGYFLDYVKTIRDKVPSLKRLIEYLEDILLIVVGGLLVIIYVLARLFMFVEAFINIRRLPIGVYVSMDWAEYIPHL